MLMAGDGVDIYKVAMEGKEGLVVRVIDIAGAKRSWSLVGCWELGFVEAFGEYWLLKLVGGEACVNRGRCQRGSEQPLQGNHVCDLRPPITYHD